MIFVTLGTFELPFNRILEEIEKIKIDDEVIIQSGYTKFESKKYKIIPFLNQTEFEDYIDKAEIVISHGGVGSILECIKKKKKTIVVPRLEKYNEHVDNHQIEIVDKFATEGYIISCKKIDELENILEKAKYFIPNEYKSNNIKLISYLKKYIDN